MKRRALGKGLDALLPQSSSLVSLSMLDIDRIQPNPLQPRVRFDPEKLEELAASIAHSGVLQPIVVRPVSSGYEIVVGERRWRAAQRAQLSAIPCIVQDVSDREMLEMALVENLQRDDLSAIEEAQGYRLMIEQFGFSQSEVAERVGRSRAAVANTVRLLQLPQSIQQMITDGELSMGHARALISLPEAEQLELAGLAVKRGLSVREVEKKAQRLLSAASPRPQPTLKDPNILAAERKLEEIWKTRVEIHERAGSGRIVLYFHSQEELQRLFEDLTGA